MVNGLEGICMFVWECINTEGHHIGMCVDTFMFGSCCAHNLTSSQISQIPDASEPAILYTQPGLRPAASSRPNRPRPKPSTTARPALYLPNDADRHSSNGRPSPNQLRPVNYNEVGSLYGSIDKSDTNWSSSQRPPSSHSAKPTPSQHFQTLPDRLHIYSRPNQFTSQTSTKSPTPNWITVASSNSFNSGSTEVTSATAAASNSRPTFVSRPTVLSTVLPVQNRHNSSHFFAFTTRPSTTKAPSPASSTQPATSTVAPTSTNDQ